mmetsp:Transcript_4909/g.9590  ORF Transcript_4909/g.9590 Transcript_4909/m.9590 type:complete len:115 (+) Transcript_4909:53-397(+)|eukprot:CAMPEP_0172723844 /NCGR_PEP_ID=MMETSP1074-20121228/84629_1 /TAXON_ID=2916 /ORGANISM="Ceratium fusus, Strain PA161109" /LENGTH=114 /DNA_ID=CAMNT_0013550159 /DNA_START=53 /DNA_END=397 /DNA_ORIENTATION=+
MMPASAFLRFLVRPAAARSAWAVEGRGLSQTFGQSNSGTVATKWALGFQPQMLLPLVPTDPGFRDPGSNTPTELPSDVIVIPKQAVNTSKQLRQWKYRRKKDGGKDRRFRLKYG